LWNPSPSTSTRAPPASEAREGVTRVRLNPACTLGVPLLLPQATNKPAQAASAQDLTERCMVVPLLCVEMYAQVGGKGKSDQRLVEDQVHALAVDVAKSQRAVEREGGPLARNDFQIER